MKQRKWTAAACAAAIMLTSITGFAAAADLRLTAPQTQSLLIQSDIPTPVITIEKLADDSARLSWGNEGDSDIYTYQYDLALDAAFTSIQTSNENYSLCTFKMSALEQNTPYYFRVRACKDGEFSDYARTVVRMPDPTAPVTLETPKLRTEPFEENSVKLMWDAVPYATGYQYHFSDDAGFHEFIKTGQTQKLELKMVRLVPGTHYYVRICAVCEINGKTYYSDYDATEVLIPAEGETTEPPTTEPPTTEAPTTEATEPPTTEAPTTEATEPPTTEAPTTEATEPSTTEAPSTETTEPTETAPIEAKTPGDVNGDGNVDASDAADLLIAVARMGAGEADVLNASQKEFADMDHSGSVDAGDASLILMYTAYLGAGGTESYTDYASEHGWILP